jgi:hypothetical protein
MYHVRRSQEVVFTVIMLFIYYVISCTFIGKEILFPIHECTHIYINMCIYTFPAYDVRRSQEVTFTFMQNWNSKFLGNSLRMLYLLRLITFNHVYIYICIYIYIYIYTEAYKCI